METKNIEVIQLKKSDREVAPEKKGKLQPTPPKGEVGGRGHYWKVAQCTVCGYIGFIWYDTEGWQDFECGNCGAIVSNR